MKEIYLSKEGLEKLKKELNQLKTVSRREIAERIKQAKEYGDLTENAEYEDAKNEQSFVEGRILEIENILKKAKVIQKPNGDKVEIGSRVTVISDGEKESYTLVDRTEVDLKQNKISFDSPLGSALLGKIKSAQFETTTPSGKIKYKIIGIE